LRGGAGVRKKRLMRVVATALVLPVVVAVGVVSGGCNVPTPLAPAEPIGAFPTWGEGFATPQQQPRSALGPGLGAPAGDDGTATSSAGQAMPGAVKDFSGGDPVVGKGIYVALCARCHGADGEGGALPGNVVVPALADAALQARLTDAQMARSIALGKNAMPSFRAELDRDKLAAVIAYVRGWRK
jgi:mono/diheme cytochrome c family protein